MDRKKDKRFSQNVIDEQISYNMKMHKKPNAQKPVFNPVPEPEIPSPEDIIIRKDKVKRESINHTEEKDIWRRSSVHDTDARQSSSVYSDSKYEISEDVIPEPIPAPRHEKISSYEKTTREREEYSGIDPPVDIIQNHEIESPDTDNKYAESYESASFKPEGNLKDMQIEYETMMHAREEHGSLETPDSSQNPYNRMEQGITEDSNINPEPMKVPDHKDVNPYEKTMEEREQYSRYAEDALNSPNSPFYDPKTRTFQYESHIGSDYVPEKSSFQAEGNLKDAQEEHERKMHRPEMYEKGTKRVSDFEINYGEENNDVQISTPDGDIVLRRRGEHRADAQSENKPRHENFPVTVADPEETAGYIVSTARSTVVERGTPGIRDTRGIRIRIAGFSKSTQKVIARSLIATATRGNGEVSMGYEKAKDVVLPMATVAVEGSRRIVNGFKQGQIDQYTFTEIVRDKQGHVLKDPSTGMPRTITYHGRVALERLKRQWNQELVRYGISPIRGTGQRAAILIQRQINRLLRKKTLTPDEVHLLDTLRKMLTASKQEAFSKPSGLLRKSKVLLFRHLPKYLKQNETGQGLALVMAISRGVVMALKSSIRVLHGTTQLVQIAARTVILNSARAALRHAQKAEAKALGKGAVEAAKKAGAKVGRIQGRMARRQERIGRRTAKQARRQAFRNRFMENVRDPLHIKRGLRALRKRAFRRIHTAVRNRFGQTLLYRAASAVFHAVGSALGAVATAFATVLNAVAIILVIFIVFGIVMAFVNNIISSASGLFDLSSAEERKRKAAIEQVEKCYQDDIDYLAKLSDKYESVNITVNKVKDDEEYEKQTEDVEAEDKVVENTNVAEILSMVYVRFDYDFDGFSKAQIKKYAKELYYGSHEITVREKTYTDSNNKVHKNADVTFTTYYYTSLFDCSLKSSAQRNIASANVGIVNSQDDVYVYLRDQGYTIAAACGIMGNIQQESNFRPDAVTGSYYGMVQWDCIDAIKSYCALNGLDYNSAAGQMAFLNAQLNNEVGYVIKPAQVLHYLKTTDDVQFAAELFCVAVERCVGGKDEYHYWDVFAPYSKSNKYYGTLYQDLGKRVAYAQAFYEKYATYGDDYKSLASVPSGQGGNDLTNFALQYVGNKYVWGGESLTNGADCSGFIMQVYKQFGYSLPHSSASQRSVGYEVNASDPSQWMPGDILCWNGHVALYLGNTEAFTITDTKGNTITVKPYSIVHASNEQAYPKGGIKVYGTGDPNYWKTYHGGLVAVRRVLN